MDSKIRMGGCILFMLLAGLFYHLCFADEILFRDQKGRQIGTVLEEDEQSVTIRFPKESIKSIAPSREKVSRPSPRKVIWEEQDDYLILKIPRQRIQVAPLSTPAGAQSKEQEPRSIADGHLKEKIERLEKKVEDIEKTAVLERPDATRDMTAHETLMQEEMGSVKGVIVWQGNPLKAGKVKIVLERYTGFSLGSLKKIFLAGEEKSSETAITLETQTDSQGRYLFSRVPPGYYRLYWLPETETSWLRRLREKPDFEVLSRHMTVQNIPENKK